MKSKSQLIMSSRQAVSNFVSRILCYTPSNEWHRPHTNKAVISMRPFTTAEVNKDHSRLQCIHKLHPTLHDSMSSDPVQRDCSNSVFYKEDGKFRNRGAGELTDPGGYAAWCHPWSYMILRNSWPARGQRTDSIPSIKWLWHLGRKSPDVRINRLWQGYLKWTWIQWWMPVSVTTS